MNPPKVVVYGNTIIPAEQLASLSSFPLEVTPIPDSFPADRLNYLAPFHLILFNSTSESEENLERIRALRRAYQSVPVIMASANPSAIYLIQAFRHGITDCLLAPFSPEQLVSLVSTYLPANTRKESALADNSYSKDKKAPVIDSSPLTGLYCQFLNTFRLSWQGKPVDLPGGARQRSLLAFLLYHSKIQVPRDRILQSFWPDHDPDCAKNNLNVSICNLRRQLGAFIQQEVIVYQNESFFIHPDLRCYSDLDECIIHYNQGKTAERRGETSEAVGYYQAMLQMGCHFLDEFRQEEWTLHPREEFIEKYIHALDFTGSSQQQAGNFEGAIATLRKMLSIDACLESAHHKIMACYLAWGKKEKAVRQYLECQRVLQEELDMRPSAEIRALYQIVKG